MGVTSKSPRRVAAVALGVSREKLPAYSHRCSPKVFTQHQLFACLVLRNFWKTDYRGLVAQLADNPAPTNNEAITFEVVVSEDVGEWDTDQCSLRVLLRNEDTNYGEVCVPILGTFFGFKESE
jgi:hypothetical protein